MTDYIKGGRGKKAPYKTVVIRVPEPLADTVNELIEDYRETGEVTLNKPVTSLEKPVTSLGEVINILNFSLTLKANAGGKIKDAIREALKLLQ